jgi:hypothetical protein
MQTLLMQTLLMQDGPRERPRTPAQGAHSARRGVESPTIV